MSPPPYAATDASLPAPANHTSPSAERDGCRGDGEDLFHPATSTTGFASKFHFGLSYALSNRYNCK